MRITNSEKKCLKEGIVTKEMLGKALYSYNKRAKNCRDQERKYRFCPEYRMKYREDKKMYYRHKDELLDYVQPCEVHIVTRTSWGMGYFDGCIGAEYDEIYLFYVLGDYSFHSPILHVDLENYSHLPVVELEDLQTFGKDTTELMSVQTCDKIRNGLRNGTLVYVGDGIDAQAA